MAVLMQIMTSQLHSHGRFDPEYYVPSHLDVENALRVVDTKPLGKLGRFSCSAFYPAATQLYNDTGRPFIRCVDVVSNPVLSSDQPFARIPEDFADQYGSIQTLHSGDIIISKVGTPCFASLIPESLSDVALTRTVLGISAISPNIDKGYLIAFLRSKYGFDQLLRQRELTIQYQLTLERTRRIKVFMPSCEEQKYIGDLIRKYQKSKELSKITYSSARALLSSALKENELKFCRPLSYSTRFSDVMREGRADADFFNVPFMQMHGHLDQLECVPLSSLVDFVKGVEVGSNAYTENGKLFMRVGNLTEHGVKFNASDKHIPEDLYQSFFGAFQPKQGELLLTKDGTPGICWVVDRSLECIVSGAIVRLLPKNSDVPPEYLALTINSTLCRMQVEQHASGALILHWKLPLIKKLRIPLCDKDTMNKIAHLVEESKRQQYESESFLAAAKNRVEELIESAVK